MSRNAGRRHGAERAGDTGALVAALGGAVPVAAWQSFPTDLDHFVAHEARRCGQICHAAGSSVIGSRRR